MATASQAGSSGTGGNLHTLCNSFHTDRETSVSLGRDSQAGWEWYHWSCSSGSDSTWAVPTHFGCCFRSQGLLLWISSLGNQEPLFPRKLQHCQRYTLDSIQICHSCRCVTSVLVFLYIRTKCQARKIFSVSEKMPFCILKGTKKLNRKMKCRVFLWKVTDKNQDSYRAGLRLH